MEPQKQEKVDRFSVKPLTVDYVSSSKAPATTTPEPNQPPFSPHADSPAGSTGSTDRFSHSHVSSPSEKEDNNYAGSPEFTPANSLPPVIVAKQSVRDEPMVVNKVDIGAEDGVAGVGEVEETGGVAGRRSRPKVSNQRRLGEGTAKRVLLGFRIWGFLFCLVSFSVMAADRNKGWAIDSFYNYKEFRYCISVNVIGFVYSGLQICDLAFQLRSQIRRPKVRYYLDFILDQVIAYLLMSSSSSAATRVDDWKSNWGQDKFPDMASASVGLSFTAFVALAMSSLLSGYILCSNLNSI